MTKKITILALIMHAIPLNSAENKEKIEKFYAYGVYTIAEQGKVLAAEKRAAHRAPHLHQRQRAENPIVHAAKAGDRDFVQFFLIAGGYTPESLEEAKKQVTAREGAARANPIFNNQRTLDQ